MANLTLEDVKKKLTKDLEGLISRVNESNTSGQLLTILNELEDLIMSLEGSLSNLVNDAREKLLK